MNRAPLGIIALVYAAGILLARFTDIPFIVFIIAAFLVFLPLIAFSKTEKIFIVLLLITILFLGSAALRNSESLSFNHISNFTPKKGKIVSIEGIIVSDPVKKARSTSFVLKTQKLNNKINVSGKVLARVFKENNFHYGDKLVMFGKLYAPPYFYIAKSLNYRGYLAKRGIYTMFSVGKNLNIELIGRNKANPVKAFLFFTRQRMKQLIQDYMPGLFGSVLNAIILGERENLSKDLRLLLARSGTIHIIAISGLHVGIVSLIILMVLKAVRIPRKAALIIMGVILVMYCILTGARTPVVRVTIMAIIVFFGYIIDRETNIFNTLSAAALLILLFNPQALFSISFQFSFISILSILLISPKIKNILFKNEKHSFYFLASLFSGSLAAWIGLLPLVAYYFNIISPIAILANMVVVPYLGIVLGSALIFIFFGSLLGFMAPILSATSELSIVLLFKFISILTNLPGAYFHIFDLPFSVIVLYYLLIITLMFPTKIAKEKQ